MSSKLRLLFMFIVLLLLSSLIPVLGEGSREAVATGGARPSLSNDVYVYVNAGEDVLLGSNVGISWLSPTGIDNGSCAGGNLNSPAAETAGPLPTSGGYNPGDINNPNSSPTDCVFDAEESGIYIISYSTLYTYWDVTVRTTANNASTTITGRTYVTIFAADFGGWFSPGGPGVAWRQVVYILTRDGYLYRMNMNDVDGFVMQFYSNNKGLRDANGLPVYTSGNANLFTIQDPTTADTATDWTNKIFINVPAADLPLTAPINSTSGQTSTWLLTPPINIEIINFTFTPTAQQGGNAQPGGGQFAFTVSNGTQINYDIVLTFSNPSYQTRRLVGSTNTISTTANWDGLDGTGAVVASSNVSAQLTLKGGEVHFPYQDVEYNYRGMILQLLQGNKQGDPLTVVTSNIYYNDSTIGRPGGPTPLNASITPVDSSAGAHVWGNNFGDALLIDTWSFLPDINETNNFTVNPFPPTPTNTPLPPTATNTPVPPTATFTATPEPTGIELLQNGSYEVVEPTDPLQAAFWGFRSPNGATGERRLCNSVPAFEGVCVYQFRGSGPTEDSILQQRLDLSSVTLNAGDRLFLRGQVWALDAPNYRIRLAVTYNDGTTEYPQIRFNTATSGWTPLRDSTTGQRLDFTITRTDIAQIRLIIWGRNTLGRANFDAMSVQLIEPSFSPMIPMP
ncbi:MAG: hypothetical protein MUF87_01570 [Anaerolineae bacterium]|jgi:hypothetical protein|nr:hypothetical protein [Anaerolineae bacterium]